MDAYSQLKPAWFPDRIAALKEGLTPKPVHVQMILSDLCNQDCSFCAYRMSAGLTTELFKTEKTHNPNRKMDTDKALEIIDDCAGMGVQAIQFTGGGEPTVHKNHLFIIDWAQRKGLKTALVTNGIKLDTGHKAIQNLDWIRISVDAGTKETYAKIRRVSQAHWDKVWLNIGRLRDYKGVLGVGFVITPENYHEIGKCAALCRANGVSNMRVGAVFSEKGISYYGDCIENIIDEIRHAKDKHESVEFNIIDLFGRRLRDLEHGSPDHEFCGYQYFTTYIGADLNVYRCCSTAYTLSGKLGSLVDTRFRDFEPAYSPFDARKCRFCQFLGQNQAINSLIKRPLHSEFV